MSKTVSDVILGESPSVDLEAVLAAVASAPISPGADPIRARLQAALDALGLERLALWIRTVGSAEPVLRVHIPEGSASFERPDIVSSPTVPGSEVFGQPFRVLIGPSTAPSALLVGDPGVDRGLSSAERLFLLGFVQTLALQLQREIDSRSRGGTGEHAIRASDVEMLAGLGSWRWDVVANVVTWSENLSRMAGKEASPSSYAEFVSYVHPDDRGDVEETVKAALAGERSLEFQARNVRADGSVGWVQVRALIERDDDGIAQRVYGTTQDITELRRTQEALRSSEARFRGLFMQFPFSVQIFDPLGRTLQVNPAFETFWGYGIERLPGFNPLTNPQLEPIRELVQRGFAGEMVFLPPVLFDGSHLADTPDVPGARWVQGFMFPVRDPSGRLREVILVHQDVTQEKKAQEQLRLSEESYRTIFDLASDAIFVHHPVTGAVLDVNQQAAELHGMPAEELKEAGLAAISNADDPASREQAIEYIRRAAAGEPQRFEWLVRRGPETIWVEVKLNGVTILGEDRVLANVRNIHERKLAEAAIRQANEELEARVVERTAELQTANRALSASVADHEQARAELTRRTDELQGIFQALPDLYFRLSADGTVLHYRSGGDQGLYVPPEQFIGRRITDVMPPDVARLIGDALAQVTRSSEPALVEYPLTDDGQIFEYEARIVPLPDGSRIAIVRDITLRKEAERRLQEREKHFRRLIENAHDMVVIMDVDGMLQYGSPSVQRILGYEPEALTDREAMEFVHPEDVPMVAGKLARMAAAPDAPVRIECRFRHSDGSWRHLEAVGTPVSPDDPAGGFVFNVRDVTERHAAENALREREEHFRSLIENAHDITCIWDEQGVMLYQSPSLERRLGYSPSELIGRSGFQYIHPDDIERAKDALIRMLRDPGTTSRLEYRFRHRDGSWRMMEAFGRTLLQGSAHGGVVLNIRDVTERMLAERALEQAMLDAERAREAAERANRAKSEFLSRMSHELRTPMNSILGFGQLLDRADMPPDQRRGIQHILKAGRHLLHLINEVLEIARIEAGRQNFSLEPVRIRGALAEAVGLVRPLAAQRAVQLEDGPWENGEHFVRADRQRLVQVLLNLLSNAVKYNRPGGEVYLSCSLPDPELDGRIAIRIVDTGLGIPDDRRDELFTPFSRLGAEQTEVEGTGLGLALSQRLAVAMGGDLQLETSSAAGSVFRLELEAADDPVRALEDEGVATGAADDVDHDHATLLYIEDNLANLTLVESILALRPKWRTIPALQGRLGVELAVEHRPELILLDLHLPDLPGEEVFRRLRADPRTAEIPVIVISADATRASQDRLAAAGADGYLTKPLDVDEFLSTLDRFLNNAG